MPRLPVPGRVPWQLVLTVGLRIAQEGRRRWERLSAREQREVTRIVRKSRGRLRNLSAGERTALREMAWKAVGPSGR